MSGSAALGDAPCRLAGGWQPSPGSSWSMRKMIVFKSCGAEGSTSCSDMTLCSVTQASREARAGKSHPGGDNHWSQRQHCQHCLQSFPRCPGRGSTTPGLHKAQFDTSQDFISIKWLFLSGSCNLIKYQSGLAVHTQLDTATRDRPCLARHWQQAHSSSTRSQRHPKKPDVLQLRLHPPTGRAIKY